MSRRERYAIVGTGHRAEMYVDALLGTHSDIAELVALSDTNPGRVAYYQRRIEAAGQPPVAVFDPDDLQRSVAELSIDRVIVTTPDHTHAGIVARSLLAGADVVVEKPMTIDNDGIGMIREAMATSGGSVATTFNYRYSPRNSALKEVIQSGRIGEVTSVHFEWILDTVHGADYFRRWHRDKVNSGGLLVHKASHHFDLVNWWIAASPRRVYASGGLRFYGDRSGAGEANGPRPERGTGASDPFSLDLRDDPRLTQLYLDSESYDGYIRDRDVFDAGITIEDNIAVLVDYDSDATLSYSLNAHAPWEGYRVSVNGTAGRAELNVVERGSVTVGDDGHVVLDPSAWSGAELTDPNRSAGAELLVQRHWEAAELVAIPEVMGGHGGGDEQLLADIFARRAAADDPLGRPAAFDDGLRAISVGIAGNRSLITGQPVLVPELGAGTHRR